MLYIYNNLLHYVSDCIALGLDVSRNCSDGDVRLVGGAVEYEGLVEICVNGAWGTVCYGTSSNSYFNYWGYDEARIVCRQLGHQEYGMLIWPSFT